MKIYQIYAYSSDYSWDMNDVLPTSHLFTTFEKAQQYVKDHGLGTYLIKEVAVY